MLINDQGVQVCEGGERGGAVWMHAADGDPSRTLVYGYVGKLKPLPSASTTTPFLPPTLTSGSNH